MNLREIRVKRNLKVQEVSDYLCCLPSVYSRYENGNGCTTRSPLSLRNLSSECVYLKTSFPFEWHLVSFILE